MVQQFHHLNDSGLLWATIESLKYLCSGLIMVLIAVLIHGGNGGNVDCPNNTLSYHGELVILDIVIVSVICVIPSEA